MTARRLAAVVEGHGEVEALPLLIRRIYEEDTEALCFPEIKRSDVLRLPRSKMLKEGELEDSCELAARRVGPQGGVLIMLDADDDLPCQLAPQLLARVERRDVTMSVVLPEREFETWFLHAATSLAGSVGLPETLVAPARAGEIRGAKEWLAARMGKHAPYRPRLHQPKFAARMSLAMLNEVRSFLKFRKEIRRLLSP